MILVTGGSPAMRGFFCSHNPLVMHHALSSSSRAHICRDHDWRRFDDIEIARSRARQAAREAVARQRHDRRARAGLTAGPKPARELQRHSRGTAQNMGQRMTASETTWGPVAATRDTPNRPHVAPPSAALLGMSPCFGDPYQFAVAPLTVLAAQIGGLLVWLLVVVSVYFAG